MAGDIHVPEALVVMPEEVARQHRRDLPSLTAAAERSTAQRSTEEQTPQVLHRYGPRVAVVIDPAGAEDDRLDETEESVLVGAPSALSEDTVAGLDVTGRLGLQALQLRRTEAYAASKAERPRDGESSDASGHAEPGPAAALRRRCGHPLRRGGRCRHPHGLRDRDGDRGHRQRGRARDRRRDDRSADRRRGGGGRRPAVDDERPAGRHGRGRHRDRRRPDARDPVHRGRARGGGGRGAERPHLARHADQRGACHLVLRDPQRRGADAAPSHRLARREAQRAGPRRHRRLDRQRGPGDPVGRPRRPQPALQHGAPRRRLLPLRRRAQRPRPRRGERLDGQRGPDHPVGLARRGQPAVPRRGPGERRDAHPGQAQRPGPRRHQLLDRGRRPDHPVALARGRQPALQGRRPRGRARGPLAQPDDRGPRPPGELERGERLPQRPAPPARHGVGLHRVLHEVPPRPLRLRQHRRAADRHGLPQRRVGTRATSTGSSRTRPDTSSTVPTSTPPAGATAADGGVTGAPPTATARDAPGPPASTA